jgi:predicted RNA methylase
MRANLLEGKYSYKEGKIMRLAGQEKMGFYPTPPIVAEQLLSILDVSSDCKVLDPCCGEGAVLSLFKDRFGVETYGVELDAVRFKKAETCVDYILNCDSVNELKAEKLSFDILWENPPYDWDVVDGEDSQRLEKTFYKAHKGLVSPYGIVVLLIPFSVLESCVNLLSRLGELRVFAFPRQEYKVFRQVVIIGRQYLTTDEDENYRQNQKLLKTICKLPAETAYMHLETTEQAALKGEKLSKVVRSVNRVTFRSRRIDVRLVHS